MKSGYELLAWLNNEDSKEYVCSREDKNDITSYEQLSDLEKTKHSDVNQIVGTERW